MGVFIDFASNMLNFFDIVLLMYYCVFLSAILLISNSPYINSENSLHKHSLVAQKMISST